jgi:hypothetical protein
VGYAALQPHGSRVLIIDEFREVGRWLAWELHVVLVLADFLTGVLFLNRA